MGNEAPDTEAAPGGWEPEDFYRIRVPEDSQISPNGSHIAYSEQRMAEGSWDVLNNIFVVDTKGGQPHRITTGHTDSAPRWAPNGKRIAFTRDTGGGDAYTPTQVFMVSPNGGKPQQVTHLPDGASDPVWSPNGRYLLITGQEHILDDADAWHAAQRGDDLPAVRTIREPFYREDDDGFSYNWRSHIWVVDLLKNETRELTASENSETAATWSPDGTKVAFLRSAVDADVRDTSTLWVMDFKTGASRPITTPAIDAGVPNWSPDGKHIAFTGSEHLHSDNHEDLYVVSSEGGEIRNLTQGKHFTVDDQIVDDMRSEPEIEPWWSPDGTSVITPLSINGSTQLASIDIASRRTTLITKGDQHVYGATVSRDGSKMALAISTDTSPGEVFVQPTGEPGAATQLTNLNTELLAERGAAKPEPLTVTASDGTPIQAWILRARGGGEAKAPTIVEIHGGPQAMYGHSFMLEFQLLAAKGYNVVFGNPRGSTGYGRKFSAAVFGDTGGKDYKDIMSIVDAAIKSGGVDANRLGVAGGSYGGFMVNWIVGHTQRFKAAIAMRSYSNLTSAWGVSDGGITWTDEFGGTPWEKPAWYLRHSPIHYVKRMRTPLLLMQSEDDLRTPISEAEQLYASLKKIGKAEVEMVRFEDQSHDLSRSGHPRLRVIRYQKILDWFDRHIAPLPPHAVQAPAPPATKVTAAVNHPARHHAGAALGVA